MNHHICFYYSNNIHYRCCGYQQRKQLRNQQQRDFFKMVMNDDAKRRRQKHHSIIICIPIIVLLVVMDISFVERQETWKESDLLDTQKQKRSTSSTGTGIRSSSSSTGSTTAGDNHNPTKQKPSKKKKSSFFSNNANTWNLNPHIWSHNECRERKGQKQEQQQHQQPKQQHKEDSTLKDREQQPISIDIVSTGSNTRIEYLQAQQQAFIQHSAIRNFFPITEHNDTDAHCSTDLSYEQYHDILRFCETQPHSTSIGKSLSSLRFWREYSMKDVTAKEIRTNLFGPKQSSDNDKTQQHVKNIGWLCAQQRPVDGMRIAIEHYRRNVTEQNHYNNNKQVTKNTTTRSTQSLTINDVLPDYLVLMDDDTYIHVDILLDTLRQQYPSHERHVVAGCVYHYPIPYFAFPWGGFGTILSRAALQRFLHPIDCFSSSSSSSSIPTTAEEEHDELFTYTKYVCWRIYEHNYINETLFFVNNMSVADLMIQYMQQQTFSAVANWKPNTFGNCFHSDHILAYFLNFYFITTSTKLSEFPTVPSSSSSATTPTNSTMVADGVRHVYDSIEQLRKSNPIRSIDPCRSTECSHVGYDKCRLSNSSSLQKTKQQYQPHTCHNIDPKDMILLYQQEQD